MAPAYLPGMKYKTKWQRDLREAVFERDGHACVSCGWRPGDPVPVDRRKKYRIYRTLEVDHIVARYNGGTHDFSNLQTLCSSCNASKGKR
jgi:5-methylcytosine-specific restriction endonuclease McrA